MIKIRSVEKRDLKDLLWNKDLKKLKRLEERYFQRFLDEKLLWLVADNGKKTVGQVKAKIENEPIIFALRVLVRERGKGIGSRLMLEMERMLSVTGFKEVFISVGVENLKAQKLYEKLGYKIVRADVVEEWEYADDVGNICLINLNVHRLIKEL